VVGNKCKGLSIKDVRIQEREGGLSNADKEEGVLQMKTSGIIGEKNLKFFRNL